MASKPPTRWPSLAPRPSSGRFNSHSRFSRRTARRGQYPGPSLRRGRRWLHDRPGGRFTDSRRDDRHRRRRRGADRQRAVSGSFRVLRITPQVAEDDNGNPTYITLQVQLENNSVDTSLPAFGGPPALARQSLQYRHSPQRTDKPESSAVWPPTASQKPGVKCRASGISPLSATSSNGRPIKSITTRSTSRSRPRSSH